MTEPGALPDPVQRPSTGPSVLSAPLRAFLSRQFYRDVARGWRWRAFVYLAYLLCILWIPVIVTMHQEWGRIVASDVNGFVTQIPSITITNGHVTTDAPEPYFIHSTGKEPFEVIIDTTGRIVSLDGQAAQLLLTADKMFIKQRENETRVYDLSAIQSFAIDAERVRGWLRVTRHWGPLLLGLLAVVGALAYRAGQALFYSLFGLAIARGMRLNPGYGAILSLTIAAMTPAIVLKAILVASGLAFPYRWVLLFGLSMVTLAFALDAQRGGEAQANA
jgi:uncharacterized protein DUF1189